jgi:hypothetical protein
VGRLGDAGPRGDPQQSRLRGLLAEGSVIPDGCAERFTGRERGDGFVAFVRSQTFSPRQGLDMLFVAIDVVHGIVMKAWLVPSQIYAEALGKPNSKGRYRFSASMKDGANDRWRSYRLEVHELPQAVVDRATRRVPPST